MKWELRAVDDECIDFEMDIVWFKDLPHGPSVQILLTFLMRDRKAYIVFQQLDDLDGTNETDFGDEINITWEEGLRLLRDTPLPKELKEGESKCSQ